MNLYPLMANLEAQRILVVGGGKVATRKIQVLLKTNAEIQIISPEITQNIESLISEKRVSVIKKHFSPNDLDNCALVFAATNDPNLNDFISDEAIKRGIPVNNITNQKKSTFFVPSQITRGDLILAISTSGKSPATAKWIRQRLEREFGPEYGTLIRWMSNLRHLLEQKGFGPVSIGQITEYLLDQDILSIFKTGDEEDLLSLIKDAFRSVLKAPIPEDFIFRIGMR